MTFPEIEYTIGRVTYVDECGNTYDPDSDVNSSIPTEWQIPVESLTDIANNPGTLFDHMVQVPNIYERNDTSALT